MPVETITQILLHLYPYDLVQLYRTCKALRNILEAKCSKHIWVAARASMGVPDCKLFSEPYYANFLFNTSCSVRKCRSKQAWKMSFAFGVRLCKRCFERSTLTGDELYDEYPLAFEITEECLQMVPPYSISPHDEVEFLEELHFPKVPFKHLFTKIEAYKDDERRVRKTIRKYKEWVLELNESTREAEAWYAPRWKSGNPPPKIVFARTSDWRNKLIDEAMAEFMRNDD